MRQILITLLLTASTAHAQTWHQLGYLDKNGGAIFVDTSSIDRDSEIQKARFKFVYKADRPIGSGYSDVPPGVQSYRWETKLGHFNCTDSTAIYSQSTLYNADDQAVGNIAIDPSILKFQKVAPETSGGVLLQAVCGAPTFRELPGPEVPTMTRAANPVDFYPQGSIRRAEQGAPTVRVCVDPSGKLLRDPEVVESSGFRELDAAAIKVAKSSRYKAGTKDDQPLPESCIKFRVTFAIRRS
jgi:TonB family protein